MLGDILRTSQPILLLLVLVEAVLFGVYRNRASATRRLHLNLFVIFGFLLFAAGFGLVLLQAGSPRHH